MKKNEFDEDGMYKGSYKDEDILAVCDLIFDKCESVRSDINKYKNYKSVIHSSRVYDGHIEINLIDIFINTDKIFELGGHKPIFTDVTKKLSEEIEEANCFIESHRYIWALMELEQYWREVYGRVKKNEEYSWALHEAIRDLNYAIKKYNLFRDKEIICLKKHLTVRKKRSQ